jgi:murein DD-endopeptidase MepM/ murein hydrolase activator NlpD
VLGSAALLLTAYVGATAYLIYRDDLLGTAVARQVQMQYSYEDRIAALRSEIDRISSRHAVAAQGIEQQLALLLDRQGTIQRQQSALDDLVAKARGTGIEVAAAQQPAPEREPDSDPAAATGSGPAPLAYAPARAGGADVITDTLIRGSTKDSAIRSEGETRTILLDVQSALDQAEDRQTAALEALSAEAESAAEKLASALAPLGVPTEDSEAPRGGPFIAAGGMHFVERTAVLSRTLDEIAELRRWAEAMPLAIPVRSARVSSRFGYRNDPFLNRPALHAGLDFAAATGTEVHATAAGVVVAAGWNGGYGQMIEIRHGSGLSTRYGHLSAVLVTPGAKVAAGALIGRVGSTGRSTGPHLHYETRRDGNAVNPAPYLAAGRSL